MSHPKTIDIHFSNRSLHMQHHHHHHLILAMILLAIISCTVLNAQDIRFIYPDARSVALGGIGSVQTDVSALIGNQAGLASLESIEVSLTAERRFQSSALQYFAGSMVLPSSVGSFGLAIQRFGDGDFNQQLVGLAYSRKLLDVLSVGARFDYLQLRIKGYGRKGIATVEMGLQSQIIPELLIGFHVYNPLQVQLLDDEFLPTILHLGLRYGASDKVFLYGEIHKISDLMEGLSLGLEYEILERFSMRLGVRTQPQLVTFGIGYSFDTHYAIDVSSAVHPQLGVSSAGTVRFRK